MIVRDHRGKYYRVFDITGATDAPDCAMAHLWHGFELRTQGRENGSKLHWFSEKLTRAGKRRWTYVCKRTAVVVEEGP